MKILHITYIYPPNLNVADGITNVAYNVTRELSRKGHQVTVYTSNLLDLHNEDLLHTNNLIVNGVNVYYSRSLWRYKTFIITPPMIPLLQKHINDFDIIHIHDCRSFQGIIAYLFAKRKKIPYVFQPHGSFLYSLPQSFSIKIAKLALDKLISEKIVKNASKVIASSQTEAQQYRDIGVPEEKIGIMSNGIDLSKYAELPPKGSFKKKYGIDEYEKIILYLGRIHRIKGIDFLVKAFAIVIKKLDDVKLVIVGPDDGYLKEIKALIKNLSMEKNILITGLLPDKDKLEAYVDADVYVLPSRFEAFPMSVLEAYSCGKPVIASKVGGLKDLVINGETGLLVEPGNTEQLAKNILYLLNDKGKAEEMGLKGRQLVEEKYAIDKVVAKLEKVYIEVAKSKMSEKF